MAEPTPLDEALRHTPLHAEHVALGARMVPFAGYDMPVQYPTGILAEHLWTRENAGLFDVSHMGQAFLVGPDHETAARALEALVPADILNLKHGHQRYSQLLDERGGILDDLMITRPTAADDGRLMLVVNASTKEADYTHIEARLPQGVTLLRAENRALLALQGPRAADVMARLAPQAAMLTFMAARAAQVSGFECHVSRSGYTGEDGFEISVRADVAVPLWRALLAEPEVKPVGLGARDSLRLEAGLCLYGHDIDATTSPIEAGLIWSIQKRRREEDGFPGAARIQREIAEGPDRVRVGLKPEGRAPARKGTAITTPDGREIGRVTSGGFGPTASGPVAMGYVAREASVPGTDVHLVVRGKPLAAKVVSMPFVPHRYKRA
jgi:aminomethyltransferase